MRNLFKRLLRVSPTITDNEEVQRAKLMVSILFAFTATVFLFGVLNFLNEPADAPVKYTGVLFFQDSVYFACFLLARTRYYQWATHLCLAFIVFNLNAVVISDPRENIVTATMHFSIVVNLIAGIISPRATIFWTAVTTTSAVLLPWTTGVTANVAINEFIFLLISSSIGIVAAFLQRTFAENARLSEKKALEQKIQAERNLRQVEALLRSMQQGILTLDRNLVIKERYSPFLEAILENNRFAGTPFVDAVLKKSDLSKDTISAATAALESVFGTDIMNFELNNHLFPNKFVLKIKDQTKIIDATFDPVIYDTEIEEVLVVLRDVTQLEALKAEATKQSAEIEKIFRILKASQDAYRRFAMGAKNSLTKASANLSLQAPDQHALHETFRELHTVKGNARVLGLRDVAELAHGAETALSSLRTGHGSTTAALTEVHATSTLLLEYQSIFDKYFHHDQRAHPNSIETILRKEVKSLEELAHSLGKESPRLTFVGTEINIPEGLHDVLRDTFMHLFKNSLDHGLEKKELREQFGKDPHGHIRIACKHHDGKLEIITDDDGAGLDYENIKRKAVAQGLLSEEGQHKRELVLAAIFSPGFTTKDSVSEISGRGVGLDAVKHKIESKGGSVKLELKNRLANGNEAFAIHIILPA